MTKLQELTQRLEQLEQYLDVLNSYEHQQVYVSFTVDQNREHLLQLSDCAQEIKASAKQIIDRRIYAVKQEISALLFPPRKDGED